MYTTAYEDSASIVLDPDKHPLSSARTLCYNNAFFRKKSNAADESAADDMSNVFAGGAQEEVLQAALVRAACRAKEILRQDLPLHVKHLQEILDSSEHEGSLCWNGLTGQGLFLAENVHLLGVTDSAEPTGLPTPPRDGDKKVDIADAALHTALVALSPGSSLQVKSKSKCGQVLGSDDSDANGSEADGRFWGGLETNEACIKLLRVLEAECDKTMNLCRDLKRWIMLVVPTIEDGNGFGSEVQEAMLGKVDEVFNCTTRLRGHPRNHWTDRMGLARTWNRFPMLKDHPHAIAASDRWDFYLAVSALHKLKDSELMLLHSFKQNWAKIYDPKNLAGGGAATMIGGMY